MGLQILTVKKKNEDTSHAGSLMFNTNRIGPFFTINTNDTFFEYFEALHSRKTHFDKYQVDEAVATISAAIADVNKLVYALPVYIDNDASESTETKYFNTEEIAKGVAYGADATKSWLWVEVTPGRVEKFLVNKALETIKDYVMTGTTTTTTTTTSTTSTTTT
jgi:hypothetical protein